MRALALVIAVLSCSGHGRRSQRLSEHLQVSSYEGGLPERHRKAQLLDLQMERHKGERHVESALARLLVASSTASAGWQVAGNCVLHPTYRRNGRTGRTGMVATSEAKEMPPARAQAELAVSRRVALLASVAPVLAASLRADAKARIPNINEFSTAENGLMWYELRNGSGTPPQMNQTVVIDYQMSKRGGYKIYSTKDSEMPFSWTIGDGSVIPGLELGVAGGEGVPPMLPGGARRLIIAQTTGLGYAETSKVDIQTESGGELGDLVKPRAKNPIPPDFEFELAGDKANAKTRFLDIYQNKKATGQPDLVLDVILSRSSTIPPRRKKDDEDEDE